MVFKLEMSSAVVADLIAPNRVDCYVRRALVTTSVSSGAVSHKRFSS